MGMEPSAKAQALIDGQWRDLKAVQAARRQITPGEVGLEGMIVYQDEASRQIARGSIVRVLGLHGADAYGRVTLVDSVGHPANQFAQLWITADPSPDGGKTFIAVLGFRMGVE